MNARRAIKGRDDKVAIVMEHFGPLMEGRPKMPQAKLAEIWDVDPATISRVIAEAFREGWVAIRPVDGQEGVVRDDVLERHLRSIYKLETVIVVETAEEPTDPTELLSHGDDVHLQIGQAFAEAIGSGLLFRDGDDVGVGSGRGVYGVADHVYKARLRLNHKRITLVSLTGNMLVRDHSGRVQHQLDADFNIGLLRSAFRAAEVRFMIDDILVSSKAAKEKLEAYWLERYDEDGGPAHGLFGVGLLSPGHRLWEGSISEGEDKATERFDSDVRDLVNACQRFFEDHGTYPVADLSNHLFVLDAGDEAGSRVELQKMVDKVNGQLLTVDRAQLEKIQSIALVAGTRAKTAAIHQLLLDDRLKVRRLCTDSNVARDLVAAG